jgi:hypothetical protein
MKIMLTNSPMMLAKVVVHYPLSPWLLFIAQTYTSKTLSSHEDVSSMRAGLLCLVHWCSQGREQCLANNKRSKIFAKSTKNSYGSSSATDQFHDLGSHFISWVSKTSVQSDKLFLWLLCMQWTLSMSQSKLECSA